MPACGRVCQTKTTGSIRQVVLKRQPLFAILGVSFGKSRLCFLLDDVTKAPYAYYPEKGLYATFDDKRSVALKTKYVLAHNLGGIMFWKLGSDFYRDGLLQTIQQTLAEAGR
jgi:GH18 family chitinase